MVELLINKRCDTPNIRTTLHWSHLTKNKQLSLNHGALTSFTFVEDFALYQLLNASVCSPHMFLTGSVWSRAGHVAITFAKKVGIGYLFASFLFIYLLPTYLKKFQ